MKIDYEISPIDIRNNYFKFFLNDLRNRILLFIIAPYLLYFFIDFEKELFKYIVCLFFNELAIISLIILPHIYAYRKSLKKTFEIPDFYSKKSIELGVEGINLYSEVKNQVLIWETIYSMDINEKYITLILVDKSFILIPIHAFEDNIELNNFIETIKTNVRKVRKALNIVISNERPPYFLGLFGIIPVIGAIVGLIIIFTGIFKYKNKWFTLIGVAGIGFTILILSGIQPPEKEKKDPAKMIPITIERMNGLIKDIEYYKLEYGTYPDSLTQLNSIQIYDPAQSYTEKLKKFVYRVEGEKYVLFSSGYDGIENTKDDIYPEILPTSKVGLKKYTLKN